MAVRTASLVIVAMALICAAVPAAALPVVAVLPPADTGGDYSWGPGLAAAITDALSASPDHLVLSDEQVLSALADHGFTDTIAPEAAARLLAADIVISGELARQPTLRLTLQVHGMSLQIEPVTADNCAELLQKACLSISRALNVAASPGHLTDSAEAAAAFCEARFYHCRFEDADTALEGYRQALQADTDFALARFQMANLLQQLGRWGEARDEYQRASASAAPCPRLAGNLAGMHFRLGDKDRARGLWEQVASQGSDPLAIAYATNNLGTLYLARGDQTAAERQYQTALGLWPDYAMAAANLGVLERVRKNYPAAVRHLQPAAVQRADLKAAAFAEKSWGDVLRHQGNLPAALDHYRRALAIRPQYAIVYVNMGIAHKQMGDMAQAEDSYRQAISLGTNPIASAYAHNNLGNLYLARHMYRVAAGEYEQALELKPDYRTARENLAQARARIKQQEGR